MMFEKTKWAGKDIRLLEVTNSTNEDCLRFLREGASHGVTVLAEQQLAGRGRSGRNWDSPKGEAIYMSIGLLPEIPVEKVSMLTLVMALAVCKAVEESYPELTGLGIKWPNDIVLDGKKLCGILTELYIEEKNYVIVGVGINTNQTRFPEEIAETATSLRLKTTVRIDHRELAERILVCFERYYSKFEEKVDMSTIIGEYVEKLVNKDREVLVLDPKGTYEAVALGINEQGELLVRKEDGTTEAVFAGEVSVRGIYGYV